MIARPHEVGLVDSWRADSHRLGVARSRNYPMCKNVCRRVAESGEQTCVVAGCSRPDGRHQRLDADDVHHAGQIVGQHVQGHFGGDAR